MQEQDVQSLWGCDKCKAKLAVSIQRTQSVLQELGMCGLKERASLLLSAELSFYELHNFKKFTYTHMRSRANTHTHTHTHAKRDIFMEERCQQEVGECMNMVKRGTHSCKNITKSITL